MKTKAVIFDLDGTLFDTRAAMALCGNYALETLGLPTFPQKEYGYFSGGGIEEFVGGILEAAGDTKHENFSEFWRLYLEKANIIGENENTVFPEIPPLLRKLNGLGIKCCVLSNKDEESCVKIVENLLGKGTFAVIFGTKKGFLPKPDPAGMNYILKKLSVSPEEALYIGDTPIDIETAKNAGVKIAAALWGYRSEKTLKSLSPDYLINSPQEIADLI